LVLREAGCGLSLEEAAYDKLGEGEGTDDGYSCGCEGGVCRGDDASCETAMPDLSGFVRNTLLFMIASPVRNFRASARVGAGFSGDVPRPNPSNASLSDDDRALMPRGGCGRIDKSLLDAVGSG